MRFSASSLTHFGGIYLIHSFLQQLRFRTYLSRSMALPGRNRRYTLTELLVALMYPMILGLERIEVSALLKTNGVFQHITGLPSFPDPSTMRRFLVRNASILLPQLVSVHNELRQHFLVFPSVLSSHWLDCDSTVRTLYGNQEGAIRGYNPGHRGKKSYHPLLITEAHHGDCLAEILRPGNANSADGISDLLVSALSVLPSPKTRLRLRADAGFFDGDFVAFLKENHIAFAIVAHLTPPIKSIIVGLRYHGISKTFSVSSFHYQPHKWKCSERFVVLRRKIPETESKEQLTLFTVDQYAYSVIVTNLDLEPYSVFTYYQDRSAMERIIRTLKDDYPFGQAPTHSFQANALYAELSVLAYNIIHWFKRLCLPEDWQSFTLPTIRYRLLLTPGQFTRTDNIPTLSFPRNTLYQDVFAYARDKIKKLSPLL